MLTSHKYYLLLVCLLIGLIPILAQDDTFLFDATFDDPTPPDNLNIQYGNYEIADGTLSYSVDNGGFLLIPEGASWQDYAIETRLRIAHGSVWLQARTGNDLCSGYYLTIDQSLDGYDLSLANRECDFTILELRESAGVPDDWMTARIAVIGDQITSYINDEELFTATDDQYTVGYPTINVFSSSGEPAQVEFDYIRVIDLSATGDEEIVATPIMTPTDEPSQPIEAVELPVVNEITVSDDPARTVETLEELGLIPQENGQLLQADDQTISRVGAWFEPLFDDVTTTNLVMFGEIRFLPYDSSEMCLLSMRIERDEVGVAQRYLDVGINARLEAFVGETGADGTYSQATQDGLLSDTTARVLIIAYNNRLSAYFNGRAVFQNVEVTPRNGHIGISSVATTSFSICRVNQLWAYTFRG